MKLINKKVYCSCFSWENSGNLSYNTVCCTGIWYIVGIPIRVIILKALPVSQFREIFKGYKIVNCEKENE